MKMLLVTLATLWSVLGQECGCTSDEVCCKDESGYECCIVQSTMCVPASYPYTSRCCPKWTVGCTGGSVGCCDPAQTWQRLLEPYTAATAGHPRAAAPASLPADGAMRAYALVVAGFTPGLTSYEIALNGTVTRKTPVSGPVAAWYRGFYGESTRLFAWDAARYQFYFADSNGTDPGAPVVFYTLDAVSGGSTATVLKGTSGYPVGFAYHPETNEFFFSVARGAAFEYYAVEVVSRLLRTVGGLERGPGEAGAAFYAGYMTETTAAGGMVRVGFLGYALGFNGSGVGVAAVAAGGALQATWHAAAAPPEAYWLWTAARETGTDDFFSLAPSAAGTHSFAVLNWTLAAGAPQPRVVGSFTNAHPPGTALGPLGYVASDVLSGTFASIVLQKNELSDSWAVAVYDAATGAVRESALSPPIALAKGDAVSGFGLAAHEGTSLKTVNRRL
ncbi:hypothetical protein DIPPA_27007 [Diplonema papillatum]|nr:hypothetical protein DIPPA_27007 [Diplonema papillatum]